MDFSSLLFIAILIGLVILYKKISGLSSDINNMDQRFSKDLDRLRKTILETHAKPPKTGKKTTEAVKDLTAPISIIPSPIPKKKTTLPPIEPIKKTTSPKENTSTLKPTPVSNEYRPTELRVVNEKPGFSDSKKKAKSFMERNPDLEKFIGENLLSKIGIVIFVIGMGFLVKLGIDNNYITEGMRVILGVLIGGALIGLAHRLRKSFMAFSSVLIGGGLSVLYFTIAIAFHEYQILPQAAAFIIMVLITAFGVLLSISYNKKELAILALIGGFGTPFFLSTGEGNVPILFTYILILNIGMLTLVYFKKWNIINYLSFGFTLLLYVGVFTTKYMDTPDELRWVMFSFLTAIYLIFYGMALIFNIRKHQQFKYAEIGQIFTNTAIYFGFGLSLISDYENGLFNGLFTAFIALINFAFGFILYKRDSIDKNIIYLIIGLVLTFVSLIAPIQLEGNHITLFWAFESVILLWLYTKSKIKLMEIAAMIVNVLLAISLLIDWQQNYFPHQGYIQLSIIINKVFITTIIVLGSLMGSMQIFKKLDPKEHILGLPIHFIRSILNITFLSTLYLGVLFELNYQFIDAGFPISKSIILLGIYNVTFTSILFNWGQKPNQPNWNTSLLGIASIGLVSYITFYLKYVIDARNSMLNNIHELDYGFYWHYVLFVGFILLFILVLKTIHSRYTWASQIGRFSLYTFSVISVIVISAEVIHLSIIYQYQPDVLSSNSFKDALKSVIPAVWGISALILMVLGMRFKLKSLRIASLALFLITVIKLFLYDLKGNSTGKIVSFIALGAILLGVSFLYQKLKFIIQNDEKID
jgi:uncharacterized membrane protein